MSDDTPPNEITGEDGNHEGDDIRDDHGNDSPEIPIEDNSTQYDTNSASGGEGWKAAKFVKRAEWGAKRPKWIDTLETPVSKVAVSFTETEECHNQEECTKLIQELQIKHMEEEGVPDIKHNFLIGGDGVIYEGRGYTRLGPVYPPSPKNIQELNGKSIDIAIIQQSRSLVPPKVVPTLNYCIANGLAEKHIARNFDTYYISRNEIEHIRHRKILPN